MPMKTINRALFAAFLMASDAVMPAENSFSLTLGMDYSTGRYGARQSTDIWYLPLTAKYATGPWILGLTLPYIRITGPGNVVGAAGDAVQTGPEEGKIRRTASGEGDIQAAASYNIYRNAAQNLLLDVTARAKLATADAAQGLGTGENDYSLQADLIWLHDTWAGFVSLGRRKMGDPQGTDFRNPWFGSVGATYSPRFPARLGVAYEMRQPVIAGGSMKSELMVFASHRLTPILTLQAYVVKGFTDGSPDRGGGATISRQF